GGGGLESKSLGDAIAKRIYNKAVNSLQKPVDYSIMQPIAVNNLTTFGTGITNPTTFGTGSALTLSSILPKLLSVNSQNLVSYISTPTDIPSITNATDVYSIDYTLNNQAKAVSFGTQTSGEVYDHTKAICDRLKGSTLIDMKNVVVNNMNMVAYTLKDANGSTEYAMSFVIGAKSGRNNYTIQSNWLNKDYIPDETMYNIQLWAVSPDMVTNMASQIISNLQANSPVQFLDDHTVLPATYIASGNRITSNLDLTVNNNTTATSGYFVMDDQTTELSTGTTQRTVPFTIQANGKTNISIPMNDNYASTVSMYINNQLKDVVYMADGTWSYAAGPSSNVNSFKVSNDANKTYSSDELPVFRNVEINGNSADYVSIFKLMKGGGIAQDVSGYKTLNFTASGGYNLRVTLVKNSITNWADQYNTLIPLDNGTKDYSLSLSSFKSASIKDNINANDVTTVVFSIEVGNGRSNTLNTTLSNISFSKQDVAYLQSLSAKEVQVYPNPVIGNNFTCSFMSDKQTTLNLRVIDVESGRVVTTQQVNAVTGQNTVQVNVNKVTGSNVYMVALDNNEVKYKTVKIISSSR
ncbi:MAG: hypothetical protein KGL19_01040, partial [Bacteroidota bacterium]|nr:hypothetical protein [Bacteroidota bacterium]